MNELIEQINALLSENGQKFTIAVTKMRRQRYNVGQWDIDGNMIGRLLEGVTFDHAYDFLSGYLAALQMIGNNQ